MSHNDVIWDYDIIIMMSELMIPVMIAFPTIIYELVLIPSILTWSLRDMCVPVCVCLCVCVGIKHVYSNEAFLTEAHWRQHKGSEVRRSHCAGVPTLIIYV